MPVRECQLPLVGADAGPARGAGPDTAHNRAIALADTTSMRGRSTPSRGRLLLRLLNRRVCFPGPRLPPQE